LFIKVDVWALGCLFYEMLVGEYAFPTPEPIVECIPVLETQRPDFQQRMATVLHSWSEFIRRIGTAGYHHFPAGAVVSVDARELLGKVIYCL
jgi:serine/threonine protein kinase